jgi:hypothetical protein
MAEGEPAILQMLENLVDRKLGDIVAAVLNSQVAGHFNGLRDEIAALKMELLTTAAASSQQQAESQKLMAALTSRLPGSLVPSTQSSATTLSAAAEFRSQPIPDADYAAYWNPTRPGEGFNFDNDPFSDRDDWTNAAAAHSRDGSPSLSHAASTGMKPDPMHHDADAPMINAAGGGSAEACLQPITQHQVHSSGLQQQLPTHLTHWNSTTSQAAHVLSDRKSPALHRRHNPKSCMVCRGSFKKLSSCKEHMLKCIKDNSGCRFLPNCDYHQQLIRPFSGPNVEVRWMSAVTEWIHRKA